MKIGLMGFYDDQLMLVCWRASGIVECVVDMRPFANVLGYHMSV